MIWLVLGLAILGGFLYRLGGTSKGTLWRDIGVGLISLLTCALIGLVGASYAYLGAYFITFGLSWGALSAYWGLDEKKWGYWAHALGISLSILPIAYVTSHWLGFGVRCALLTALITLWSEFVTIDWLEEFGRGFLTIITLPLLCI